MPLRPKAFDTLLYLVERSGKIVGKYELMLAIWADRVVEENNLTQNISTLRRVLGEKHGENRFIATVPGQGYKFVAAVHAHDVLDKALAPVVVAVSLPDTASQPLLPAPPASLVEPSLQPPPPSSTDTGHAQNAFPTRNSTRRWLAALALICVAAVGAAALYFWRAAANPAPAATVKTIAVLPFKPLVGEARNEALEMGITDTLINKISSSDAVIVRPFSSVRRYKSLDQDAMLAGQAFGVESVLEGSIQTVGD